MVKIITIATHKGGVGKTTTTVTLGAAFARAEQACLLIDLDPQGHCARSLQAEPGRSELTIADALSEQPVPLGQAVKETSIENLHIAPSDVRLKRLTHSLYERPRREEILKKALAPVAELYDFIVIDTAPYFNPLVEMGVVAADFVIVPVEMGARAADAVTDIADLMSVLKGEDFQDWRVLRTMVDARTKVTNQLIMAGLEPYAPKLFKEFIPVSEPLNQAQIARQDIFSFAPHSPGAEAYAALAKELMGKGGEPKELVTHGQENHA
jgi:chromosome partitioning protein